MTTATGLHTRITGVIRTRQLFKPGDTLIIGLSGGADSCALLDLLATLPGFPLCLVAAHLNHCLRGADSDADEQFCRDLAARHDIPFESRRVDVRAAADKVSGNLEDAARRARFDFFDELAARWQAAAVVMGHHADDQAETVLMRLLRGSGMTGLAGMDWSNGRGYIRPLLDITRGEIEEYLIERGLKWRVDASNSDTTFLRNRIRHELLPLLESYNPAIRKALTTTVGILSEEDVLLDALAAEAAAQICRFSADDALIDISCLSLHPAALQRRIIRLMLRRLAGGLEQIGSRHLEQIRQMISAPRPNLRISLPRRIMAIKEYDRLILRLGVDKQPEPSGLVIDSPGTYQLPDGSRIVVGLKNPPFDLVGNPAVACFDLDRAPFPWHVRTFRAGDRIQPLGMSGRKKVKDIFIDEKIPLSRRSRIPLLFCDDVMIWIAGLRTSHLARIDNLSSRIVSAELQTTGY